MRQEKLHNEPITAINKMSMKHLIRRFFILGILAFALPFTGWSQPVFIGGSTLAVCQNSPAHDISSLLMIIDPNIGSNDTWSVSVGPVNGLLAGFPVTLMSFGSSLTPGPGLTYTPNPGYIGLDSFSILIDDGLGNIDSNVIIVTVTAPPVVSPITGLNTVCIGGTITLTDATGGGIWSASNGHGTLAGGNVTGVSVGNDTISYVVTGTGGCTTTATLDVAVTLLPSAGTIYGPNHVCPGFTITDFNATAGGVWSMTNGRATINTTGDVLGITPGLDTIIYTVTLPCGVGRDSFVVTIDPLPTSGTIFGLSTVCVGATITLTDPVPGGSWFRVNGHTNVSGTGVVTGVSAGVDTIIYSVINSCGAANSLFTVTVNPLPNSGIISGPSAVCIGSSITLTDPSPGGTWNATNLRAVVTGGVVSGISVGMDTITYRVINSCGIATSMYPVAVNPLPFAGAVAGLTAVCVGSTITMTDPTAAGPGIWSMTNARATINTSGVVTGVTAGADTVKYTYTNSCGTDIATYPMTVNPLPNAGWITGRTSFCNRDTIHLSDTVTGGHWRTTSSNITVDSMTGVITGVSAGTARITYTYTNFCGTLFVTRLDTIIALPDSGLISGPGSVCVGAHITLTDPVAGGAWSSGSTGVGTINSGGVLTGVSGGIDHISYTVTNVCRSAIAVYTVTVNTVPVAGTIFGDSAICPDVLVAFHDTFPGGIWTLANDSALIDDSGVVAGVHAGLDTIIYTITNACGSTSTTKAIVILSLYVCWHTGVQPVNGPGELCNIYPNPAMDEVTIKVEHGAYNKCTITNQLGQLILERPLTTSETDINVSSFAPGLYNITLTGESGIETRKMIRQ